jgi:hypothetical protein
MVEFNGDITCCYQYDKPDNNLLHGTPPVNEFTSTPTIIMISSFAGTCKKSFDWLE